jgi:hypothetical protein
MGNVGVCNRVCCSVGALLVVVFPTPHVSEQCVFLNVEEVVMPDDGAQWLIYLNHYYNGVR